MRSARMLWRICVLPAYIVLGGAVFALAMVRTQGSVIGGLAALAPWALAAAVVLAALVVVGNVARWRRRVRRARTAIRRRVSRPSPPHATDTWHDRTRAWMETDPG